jgi:Na+-translocating ferredoxin:NAD+ oxidoreductase RnfG subunit
MKSRLLFLPVASIVISGGPAYAKVYLTIEQAQALMFPGAAFKQEFRTLTDEQAKAIQHASGVAVRNRHLRVWRVSTGGWFIVDEVVGKHEFIPFAVALDDQGAVKSIEILEYREAYGDQVRDAAWRRQFVAKRPGSKLRLDNEIRNISGATLSSRRITDGVNRLLATYAIAIQPGR